MKKSIFFIAVACMLVFSGCGALFFDTYSSEKDFQGNQSIDLDSDIQMVQNYAELRRLVFNMMNNHEENAQLRFVGYSGNAASDIASVCNAIKTESAYGAYCVDYVTYDLTQIVSYYEASIAIAYKYSAEDLQLLQMTNNHTSFAELLVDNLKNGTEKLVVKINNGSSEYDVVNELIDQTIREHPLSMSYYPQFSVKIFSGNSSQKIYELNIQYDMELNNTKRIEKLQDSIAQLMQSVNGDNDAEKIMQAASALSHHGLVDELGGITAYDAVVDQKANSEGISSAFKAMCDLMKVECLIVSGRLDRAEHFWNIVKIEDAYYHIDVSSLRDSVSDSILKRDEEQQINYWWDQSAYPDCVGEANILQ